VRQKETDTNLALQALYELISELVDEMDREEVVRKVFEKVRLAIDPNLVAFVEVKGDVAYGKLTVLKSGTSKELIPGMEEEIEDRVRALAGSDVKVESEIRNRVYLTSKNIPVGQGRSMIHFSVPVPSKRYGKVMFLTVSDQEGIDEDDRDLLTAFVSQMGVAFEKAENYSRVERMARYDDLTGVFRRQYFFEVLEDEYRKGRVLSLIMFDMDRFKDVNDTHGHHKGDECLAKFGEVLRSNVRAQVRKVDHVGRYGGDEFVMLLDGSIDEGVMAAERVRREVESNPLLKECGVTTSVGVACSTLPGVSSYTDVVKLADRAAYKSKELGRNRVCYWTDGNMAEYKGGEVEERRKGDGRKLVLNESEGVVESFSTLKERHKERAGEGE
jgi:diguanylate cyclase (GGDEF)-like protein